MVGLLSQIGVGWESGTTDAPSLNEHFLQHNKMTQSYVAFSRDNYRVGEHENEVIGNINP